MSAADFIDRVLTSSRPHPESGAQRLISDPNDKGIAEVIVWKEDDNRVSVSSLITEPDGVGVGRRTMALLCRWADETRTVLVLEPIPIERRIFTSPRKQSQAVRKPLLNRVQLRRWYRKFGFMNDPDDEWRDQMIRAPRPTKGTCTRNKTKRL